MQYECVATRFIRSSHPVILTFDFAALPPRALMHTQKIAARGQLSYLACSRSPLLASHSGRRQEQVNQAEYLPSRFPGACTYMYLPYLPSTDTCIDCIAQIENIDKKTEHDIPAPQQASLPRGYRVPPFHPRQRCLCRLLRVQSAVGLDPPRHANMPPMQRRSSWPGSARILRPESHPR